MCTQSQAQPALQSQEQQSADSLVKTAVQKGRGEGPAVQSAFCLCVGTELGSQRHVLLAWKADPVVSVHFHLAAAMDAECVGSPLDSGPCQMVTRHITIESMLVSRRHEAWHLFVCWNIPSFGLRSRYKHASDRIGDVCSRPNARTCSSVCPTWGIPSTETSSRQCEVLDLLKSS